jgi:hypothetical protein
MDVCRALGITHNPCSHMCWVCEQRGLEAKPADDHSEEDLAACAKWLQRNPGRDAPRDSHNQYHIAAIQEEQQNEQG